MGIDKAQPQKRESFDSTNEISPEDTKKALKDISLHKVEESKESSNDISFTNKMSPVEIDDNLAQLFRGCLDKEAAIYSGKASTTSLQDFLKDICKGYGNRDKEKGRILDLENFTKAINDIGDLKKVFSKEKIFNIFKAVDKVGEGIVNYKSLVTYVSYSDTEIRTLAKKFRRNLQAEHGSEKNYRKFFQTISSSDSLLSLKKFYKFMFDTHSVSLTEKELNSLVAYMDIDQDGKVSLKDFVSFLSHAGDTLDASRLTNSAAIIDIQISTTAQEEAEFTKYGYEVLAGNLNEGSLGGKVTLIWFLRAESLAAGVGLPPIIDIVVVDTNTDSALVVAGYQCLNKNINDGGIRAPSSSENRYMWVKRGETEKERVNDAIIHLRLTKGNSKDRNNAIWKSPGPLYVRVDSNLNPRFLGQSLFLWFEPKSERSLELQIGSPRKKAMILTEEQKILEIRKNFRMFLRRYIPISELRQSHSTDFLDLSRVFNKTDTNQKGYLTFSGFYQMIRNLGVNLEKKDAILLLHRINLACDGLLWRQELINFLEMTPGELDIIAQEIRNGLQLTQEEQKYSNARKFLILKKRFEEFDLDNDDLLTKKDIYVIANCFGRRLTYEEVAWLEAAFDRDGDDKIDVMDFIRFTEKADSVYKLQATRVANAVETLRSFINSSQSGALQARTTDNTDSVSAWLDLTKRRSKQNQTKVKFLEADDFSRACERYGLRLSVIESYKLVSRVNPKGKGKVDMQDFHHFAVRKTKSIHETLKFLENEICRDLKEMFLFSGKKYRSRDFDTKKERSEVKYEQALNEYLKAYKVDENGNAFLSSMREDLLVSGKIHELDGPNEEELLAVAQYVGADRPFLYGLNVKSFIDGVVKVLAQNDEGENFENEIIQEEDHEAVYDLAKKLQDFLVSKATTANGSKDYQRAFDLFDEDNNGFVSLRELKQFIYKMRITEVKVTSKTLLKIFDKLDSKGEGKVTVKDVELFCKQEIVQPSANFQKRFEEGKTTPPPAQPVTKGNEISVESFIGKITGDKISDKFITGITKQLLKTHKTPEKIPLQQIQEAFLTSDPDRAGVVTKAELIKSFMLLGVSIDSNNKELNKSLEFFFEDDDLIDYEGMIHSISRLRHCMVQSLAANKIAREGIIPFTGHVRLDGKLTLLRDEFRAITSLRGKRVDDIRKDPYRIFRRTDSDHDGRITISEFKRGLKEINIPKIKLTDKDIRRIFRRFDAAGDTKINYREWIEFLLDDTPAVIIRNTQYKRDTQTVHSSSSESDDLKDAIPEDKVLDDMYKRIYSGFCDFEPVAARRKQMINMVRKFDYGNHGTVSERRFRAFLYKINLDFILTRSEIKILVRSLDPDITLQINYENFFAKIMAISDAKEKEATEKKEKEEKEKKEKEELAKKEAEKAKEEKRPTVEEITPILKKVVNGINVAETKGKHYHTLFALSDEQNTGLVPAEAFGFILKIMGAEVTNEEVKRIVLFLSPRADKKVDYEELLYVILNNPECGVLLTKENLEQDYSRINRRLVGSPRNSVYKSSPVKQGDNKNGNDKLDTGRLSRSGTIGIDHMTEHVACRIRHQLKQKKIQWGSSFSLIRQFENVDSSGNGYVKLKDFEKVLNQLEVQVTPAELSHLGYKFDKLGNGDSINYEDFCFLVQMDSREFQSLGKKIGQKVMEQKRQGNEPRSLFEMYDYGDTGFVNINDFKLCAKQLKLPVTEAQLQALIERFAHYSLPDQISYDDFLSFALAPRFHRGSHYYDDPEWTMKSVEPAAELEAAYETLTKFRESMNNNSPVKARSAGKQETYTLEHRKQLDTDRDEMFPGPKTWSPKVAGSALWGSGTPLGRKGSITTLPNKLRRSLSTTIQKDNSWLCKVCFYTENALVDRECSMCAAPNPRMSTILTLTQCTNCSFQNEGSPGKCSMCGVMIKKINDSVNRRSLDPKNMDFKNTKSKAGWRTDFVSDDEGKLTSRSQRLKLFERD